MSSTGQVLLDHYQQIYAAVYFGSITVAVLWEGATPRRSLSAPLGLRWFGNISITLASSAMTWLLFPMLTTGLAVTAAERGWGLFNLIVVPSWLAVALSFAAMDVARYFQHRVLHEFPLLWRLHRMHHTDLDDDFTTGFRFHPFEALLAAAVGLLVVAFTGAPVEVVVTYQLLLVLSVIFAHANVFIPARADRVLRRFIVTPDLHRVHHSARARETNSNYGVIVPWWDRIFGTYVDQPSDGHLAMTIGLADFRGRRHLSLPWMIANPFLSTVRPAGKGLTPSGHEVETRPVVNR